MGQEINEIKEVLAQHLNNALAADETNPHPMLPIIAVAHLMEFAENKMEVGDFASLNDIRQSSEEADTLVQKLVEIGVFIEYDETTYSWGGDDWRNVLIDFREDNSDDWVPVMECWIRFIESLS